MVTRRHDSRPLKPQRVQKPSGPQPKAAAPTAISGSHHTDSGRQRHRDTGSNTADRSRLPSRTNKRLGLRSKFMLVMSVTTGVALIALGLIMSGQSNKYLFNQKMHDGIDLTHMVAELASQSARQMIDLVAIDKSMGTNEAPQQMIRLRKQFEDSLATAVRTRGVVGGTGFSDVLAVRMDCERPVDLNNAGFGSQEDSAAVVSTTFNSIFVPKTGQTLGFDKDLLVYSGIKSIDDRPVRIYRFKLSLSNMMFGMGSVGKPANVRVDIDATSIDNVKANLTMAIAVGVLLALAAVIGIANWLAITITKPVDILMRDMQAVSRGNLDHQTKTHSTDEIGVLASEFNRMTANLKVAQVALVEQEKAEYELSIAREVQRQLLPADAPVITGFDCAAFYQGAKAVSGDYYDFIPLGNGLWGFIVADVSGKGIPGSMVMAVTRTIIRLIANKHQDHAAETLKETNRLIAKQIKRGMFVTSFYAILDEHSGSLTYASAGHNPMVIFRGSSRTIELANSKGIALGFNEGPIFDRTIEEHRTVLNQGDSLVLYTDGFPEAMNSRNEEFTDERFQATIAASGHLDARTMVERLIAAIAQHRGEAEQSDDLTIISVRRA